MIKVSWLDTIAFGGVTYQDLIFFAAIVAVSVIIAKILSVYLKKSFSDRMEKSELEKFIKITQIIIIGLGIYFGIPRVEINFADLLIVGGTLAIVIGFATQKIGSNLTSGIFLMIERPIKSGDTIQIQDVTGTVKEIHILSTIIQTFDGIYVRIPNETVFNTDITNYVANVARKFEYNVGISYKDDAGLAMGIIYRLLEEHPFILKHPSPSVYVSELGDSSVNITIYIWTPSRVWWSVKTEMLWRIKKALDEEGIEIPFPQRVVTFVNAPPADADKKGAITHE